MKIIGAIFLLLLSGSDVQGATFTDNIHYKFTADDNCQNIIGIMPHVDINTTPNAKVCVRWYDNNQPAFPPNSTQHPMGEYCRTADENGFTFFAMNKRLDYPRPLDPPNYYSAPKVCGGDWDYGSVDVTTFNFGLDVVSIDGVTPDLPYVEINL